MGHRSAAARRCARVALRLPAGLFGADRGAPVTHRVVREAEPVSVLDAGCGGGAASIPVGAREPRTDPWRNAPPDAVLAFTRRRLCLPPTRDGEVAAAMQRFVARRQPGLR